MVDGERRIDVSRVLIMDGESLIEECHAIMAERRRRHFSFYARHFWTRTLLAA